MSSALTRWHELPKWAQWLLAIVFVITVGVLLAFAPNLLYPEDWF